MKNKITIAIVASILLSLVFLVLPYTVMASHQNPPVENKTLKPNWLFISCQEKSKAENVFHVIANGQQLKVDNFSEFVRENECSIEVDSPALLVVSLLETEFVVDKKYDTKLPLYLISATYKDTSDSKIYYIILLPGMG